jgi:RNA polymerase sigma-70 factor, ECF subfamily
MTPPSNPSGNLQDDTLLPAAPEPDSDAMLVERTVAGDQRAFELLDDIAQETFIRAYRALPKFRGEAQFYTWLYRIAVNTAKKFLLEMKRDPTVSIGAFGNTDEDNETFQSKNEPISDDTPETLFAAKEIASTVNAAMMALPEDLRQAITLREIDGLSYEDIAQLMACPIGTVRSRIFRAREAISAKVGPLLEKQTGKRW